MWKQFYENARDWLTISREVQENKADIKEVKQEIRDIRNDFHKLRQNFSDLIIVVQKLSFDIEKISEREQSERQKMVLQLENEMLKFERRLPSGKDDK